MKLFLDSSVLLAASGSATGASRYLIEVAGENNWLLTSSIYCLEETRKNLGKLGSEAEQCFENTLLERIKFMETKLIIDQPMIYPVAKDRPVITTAMYHSCDALLTLDRADFQSLLGNQFYGMWILTPGDWLRMHH